MYAIRPAEFADLPAIQHLRVARARWATRKGIGTPQYRQLTQAEKKTAHPLVVTWDGEVIATTTLIDQPPYAGWTRRELAQRAIGLVRVITTPSPEHSLGWLLTYWVTDYAARSEREWVRICVPGMRLACRWCTGLGWEHVRSHHPAEDQTVHLLQRPAEQRPSSSLAALVEDRMPLPHSHSAALNSPPRPGPPLLPLTSGTQTTANGARTNKTTPIKEI
ncbi:hypothetical protein ACFWNT_44470 [Streptomyces sp. NPDC058409]|uniref:hypothetical protein n=1 Tax=Streptomyces sp. NPDC058409 TaxID=3346484 RepID=UPI00365A3C25